MKMLCRVYNRVPGVGLGIPRGNRNQLARSRPMATVDHRAAVALRKVGAPANFVWYSWECLRSADGAILLTGCVSSGVQTKGKRKGRPRYDGDPVKAVVTDAEFLAEQERFEREEHKCRECGGDGQAFASWDHKNGTKWRECVRCGGSGIPPSVSQMSHGEPVSDPAVGQITSNPIFPRA